MIRKIISGGQTGADRAALDLAIEWNIAHGGWIPKGRLAEDGPLPEKYHLREMPTSDYPQRTEKNVLDSDGTLILSHGPLTGGSALTRKLAIKHGRAWLHINLSEINAFMAAQAIHDWIFEQDIAVLNVAGSRESQDPKIYRATYDILEAVLHLFTITTHVNSGPGRRYSPPATVNEAIDQLLDRLRFKEKTEIARMEQAELKDLYPTLGRRMKKAFGLLENNDPLIHDCRSMSGNSAIKIDEAVLFMIEILWKNLQKTHRLRLVR